MATDLKDDATHEEIVAFAENAAQQVEEDRKGGDLDQVSGDLNTTAGLKPDKGDAQKIAEDHDKTPIAETDSGSDDTADSDKEPGENTGDSEDQADDWLDDDLKAEVAACGIDEKELADFTSREEVERALRLFDRAAMEAGRKALAEGDKAEPKARDGQGRFVKKEPEPEGEPNVRQYDIGLDKDAYDEELVGELTRMRDHYESRFDALETRFAEAEARAEEQHFDSLVDSLGHADLFGATGKENSKQLQRREDLHLAVKAQQIGLESLGREVDLDKSLVNRVARMVFADDLGKKDLKARTHKMSKQSNKIMGGGSVKSPGPAESLEEWADRRYKELEDA
jgi:hypothetical protein